jgi:hypothetical protein
VGTWHFANGNTVVGEFNHEIKEKDDGTEGTNTVIHWKTDPEIVDPSRFKENF